MEEKKLPEYIREYRDQSWQIEILIASGVVFSLYSITDTLRLYFFETWPVVNYSTIQVLTLFFAYFITRILLFGFIGNLVFRAVWLAYLGINFSFPEGIRYDKLSINKFREEEMRLRPNIVQRVILLERLCNLTYSLAILITLFATTIFITMVAVIWVLQLFGLYEFSEGPVFIYLLALFVAIVNSGLLDTLMFRSKGKGKLFEIKESIFGVLDYLTLAFLFKREFLVIKTNTRKWLFYLITFFIAGISLLVSVNQLGKFYPWGTFKLTVMDDRKFYNLPNAPKIISYAYESNLKEDRVIFKGCLQNDIIKDDYLKLFVVSWHRFEKYLAYSFKDRKFPLPDDLVGTVKYEPIVRALSDSLYNETINDLFTVKLDQDKMHDLKWYNYKHPITKEDGYLTYISIDSIAKNEHLLDVDVSWINNGEKMQASWLSIPFWKE